MTFVPTGVTSISAIDISGLSGVQGAWNMEDNVNDRSGNSLNLDSGVSSMDYVTLNGKRCAYRASGNVWARSTHDSALNILGALTFHHLILQQSTSENGIFCGFLGNGAPEAENYSYMLRTQSGTNKPQYYSEHGANIPSVFNTTVPILPFRWALYTVTRDGSGNVNFYVNGALGGQGNPASTTLPTGGTTAKFYVGGGTDSIGSITGFVGDTVVQNIEESAANVLAIAQQVGVAP